MADEIKTMNQAVKIMTEREGKYLTFTPVMAIQYCRHKIQIMIKGFSRWFFSF